MWLQIILMKYPQVQLRVIADEYPHSLNLPADQVDFVRWSPETEVVGIQDIDIGIMPLEDTLWNRGKCAYKMLLYMSCGAPVVASPIGMSGEIINLAQVGRSARTTDDWVGAFEELLHSPQLAVAMGKRARQVVLDSYSIHALAPKLAAQILRVAGREVARAREKSENLSGA